MSRSQDIADLRDDAHEVRTAAKILRFHSTRPRSFALRVLCHVLENAANGIDRKADKL